MNCEPNPKFWGLLSLSMKAGKLAVGESRAVEAIRSEKTKLIILSSDASDNTVKKFSDMSSYRAVPMIKMSDRFSMGAAIGRKFAVVIAVTDSGFAANLAKLSSNEVV